MLSDTHGFMDDQILGFLKESDEIWHAGDVGDRTVIDQLESLPGKLRLVYGNIDGQDIRIRSDEALFFTIDGLSVLIIHIAGRPARYNRKVKDLIDIHAPDMLICGHSHILRIENDRTNKLLYVNPGACGHHGFHHERTMVRFEVHDGRPSNMEVINLGRRGRI